MIKKSKQHVPEQPAAVADKDEQLKEINNRLLRALADFDNFRKRAAVEKEELSKFSNELLIKELLPVLDGLDKALKFSKDKEDTIKGITLIRKQLEDALARFGVAGIEALNNKYDPHFHEAISMRDSDGEAGIVIEEIQKGYTMHGRLLRPSMVIVSKNKEN